MIIKAFEIDKLKKKNEKFFLLYGENEGLKNQVFQEVFAKNFENKLERFEENEILNNFDSFISSIINKSFFDESKLILIQRTTDKIIKLIDNLLNKNITDTTIVFNSGILEKKSRLRSKFEKDKNLICVPFYKDDIKALRQIANNFFIKNKISLSQEVVNLIDAYRKRGHLFTITNPVRERRKYSPTLDIENFGLNETDLELVFSAGEIVGLGPDKLKNIIKHLNDIYCSSIGVEYMYIRDPNRVKWIQNRLNINANHPNFSKTQKLRLLKKSL